MKIKEIFSIGITLAFMAGCQSPSEKEAVTDHKDHGRDDDHYHGHSHAQATEEHGHAHLFSFLNMNGEFRMDPEDESVRNDPRNPSRITLKTTEDAGSMTRMKFYDHNDANKLLADCGYEFIGSRPDPHYYPEESKTSIWDVFEQKENFEGDCGAYQFVISRSPHGEPIHMHLRYGQDVDELLAMSNMPEDPENFNPWWSLYCDIHRNTTCAD